MSKIGLIGNGPIPTSVVAALKADQTTSGLVVVGSQKTENLPAASTLDTEKISGVRGAIELFPFRDSQPDE